jgi:hypothetical protein
MTHPQDPSSTDIIAAVNSEHTRSRIVLFLLFTSIAMAVVGVWSGFKQHQLLEAIGAGVQLAPGQAEANDSRQQAIAMVQIAVLLGTMVIWLMWQHRAYSNLKLVGSKDTEYTPGWSVGYWFIPILNLFRPYQVTAELYRRSELANQRDPIGGLSQPVIVGVWWLFWIVRAFFGRFSFSMTRSAKTIEELIRATDYQIIDDVFTIVTGVLAIIIIRNIDRFQTEFTKGTAVVPPRG